MTRDDIIRMAREAKLPYEYDTGRLLYLTELERFAGRILEHLAYDGIHTCNDQCQRPVCVAIRKAVEAEREACAQIVEQYTGAWDDQGYALAQAIRARGER